MQLSPIQFSKVLAGLQEAGKASGSDKRRFTRLAVEAEVRLIRLKQGRIVNCYTGLARDISARGAGILQASAVEKGQELAVRLPLAKEELMIIGKVAFCRRAADGLFAVGVEFDRVAEKE